MYPRRKSEGFDELRVDFDAPNFKSIEIPRGLATINNSDHAGDNATRKSYHCVLTMLNGVIVGNKVEQQEATATHSTHSEPIGTLFQVIELTFQCFYFFFCFDHTHALFPSICFHMLF